MILTKNDLHAISISHSISALSRHIFIPITLGLSLEFGSKQLVEELQLDCYKYLCNGGFMIWQPNHDKFNVVATDQVQE